VIDRREILSTAGNLGLLPSSVEKDYVLGWLLAGICNYPTIAKKWVFKGGTCLKKCYFETYRFSEDLDFTVIEETQLNVDSFTGAFRDISAWIYEKSGITFPSDKIRFEVFRNKRGRLAGEGRISYRGPIAPSARDLPRIKLDLTTDEILVLPPVNHSVLHPYSDAPEQGIVVQCYSHEEVFAEKVRALAERARPRDLYDVINLFRQDGFRPASTTIQEIVAKKCLFKEIPFPTMETLSPLKAQLVEDWAAMLRHQLPALLPVDAFWNELPAVFSWIKEGHRSATPVPVPLAPGEILMRQPAGTISVRGMTKTAPLEMIRFAASNRFCIELDYVEEEGEHNVKIIEPYSLRQTQAGDLVLCAVRTDTRALNRYRIDRIRRAQATHQDFSPQYAIDLTPAVAITVQTKAL
jgi:predicted nucleotidyltransferase component of viral defense system